jgi:serine/threonine-protein kinase RsbW
MTADEATKRTMTIESTSAALEEVRQWLLSQLKEYQYCDNDIFAVHLAFEEAFYNAIKHGNKMDPDKKVKIDCLISSDKIEISMADAGCGFNPNSVPDCRTGENLYKTEGRGILLMRSYMDEVKFNETGNLVCMIRYRHKAGDKASQLCK